MIWLKFSRLLVETVLKWSLTAGYMLLIQHKRTRYRLIWCQQTLILLFVPWSCHAFICLLWQTPAPLWSKGELHQILLKTPKLDGCESDFLNSGQNNCVNNIIFFDFLNIRHYINITPIKFCLVYRLQYLQGPSHTAPARKLVFLQAGLNECERMDTKRPCGSWMALWIMRTTVSSTTILLYEPQDTASTCSDNHATADTQQ